MIPKECDALLSRSERKRLDEATGLFADRRVAPRRTWVRAYGRIAPVLHTAGSCP